MRTFAVAALSAALMTTPAIAADKAGPRERHVEEVILPVERAPRAGLSCHVEASGQKNVTGVDSTYNFSGLGAGLGLGCDSNIGPVVIGIGARYDFLEVDSPEAGDALWSGYMRAGVMINPGTLVYGLAGIAGVDMSYSGIDEQTRGLLLGAGLEFDVAVKNLTFFAEYNHIRWDEQHLGAGASLRPDTDIFRVGAKLKFDLMK